MTIQSITLKSLALILLIGGGAARGQSPARQKAEPAVGKLGKGFVSNTAKVNGTTLYYVRGGTGPALILIHGFPQDWYEFRHVMPGLAKKFTVIAVDLRGIGRSPATNGGYDAATMAEDIYQLTQQLKLDRPYIVGHDIGGSVAYAFVRLHPKTPRGAMILETPIAGLEPWDEIKGDPRLWHLPFHQTPNLPEQLIAGREFIYLRNFLNRGVLDSKVISDAEVSHYANSYAAPDHLHAGMEMYRAFPDNEKFNATQTSAIDVPIVIVGADHSFGTLLPKVAEALRQHGCASVTIEIVVNSAHYVFEEKPDAVAELVERYASLEKEGSHK
jgi:pimeloyl-ACP methyl ester carboxylesterase